MTGLLAPGSNGVNHGISRSSIEALTALTVPCWYFRHRYRRYYHPHNSNHCLIFCEFGCLFDDFISGFPLDAHISCIASFLSNFLNASYYVNIIFRKGQISNSARTRSLVFLSSPFRPHCETLVSAEVLVSTDMWMNTIYMYVCYLRHGQTPSVHSHIIGRNNAPQPDEQSVFWVIQACYSPKTTIFLAFK